MAHSVADVQGQGIDARTLIIGVVIVAAILFIVASVIGHLGIETVDTATGRTFSCTIVHIEDGDGPINCAEMDMAGEPVSVRLRGIEARDSDGGCRITSGCSEMSWEEARSVLTRIASDRMQCLSYGRSYENVDAFCETPAGVDVSCEMVRMGAAVRWPEFDPAGRLAHCVPGQRR